MADPSTPCCRLYFENVNAKTKNSKHLTPFSFLGLPSLMADWGSAISGGRSSKGTPFMRHRWPTYTRPCTADGGPPVRHQRWKAQKILTQKPKIQNTKNQNLKTKNPKTEIFGSPLHRICGSPLQRICRSPLHQILRESPTIILSGIPFNHFVGSPLQEF